MIERIFSFLRLIILARILVPADFGLLGIAMLTMMTLENFSQTGFEAALIQKNETVKHYLDSAWTVGIIRGGFLFFILLVIAPYVAVFFEATQAAPVIRALGFSFLINAFTNVGTVFFKKELEFNKQFTYQLSGTLTDFIVTVSAALLLRSVWALVFGLLAGNTVKLVTSYTIHPYRPSFNLNLRKVKELFGFGKWILGSNIFVFFLTQGDDAVVGKILGVAALGFYQMAYKFANIPNAEITGIISQIAFPAYSKIQSNIPRLKKAYFNILKLTAFVSFPTGVMIFVLAADFTKIFLGDQWLPIVSVMKILSVYGIIGAITGSFGPVFRGIGDPHIPTIGSLFQLLMMILIICPLTHQFGMAGSAMAVLVSIGFVAIYLGKAILRILNCNVKELILPIIPPAFCSAVIFFFASFLSKTIDTVNLRFTLILTTCATIYLVLIIWLDKSFRKYLWEHGHDFIMNNEK